MTRRLRKMYSMVGLLMLLEFLAQFYTSASSGFIKVAHEISNAQNAGVASAATQEIELRPRRYLGAWTTTLEARAASANRWS